MWYFANVPVKECVNNNMDWHIVWLAHYHIINLKISSDIEPSGNRSPRHRNTGMAAGFQGRRSSKRLLPLPKPWITRSISYQFYFRESSLLIYDLWINCQLSIVNCQFSDGHFSLDVGMWVVSGQIEILELKIEDALYVRVDLHTGQRTWLTCLL